jgi:hypothetical protein
MASPPERSTAPAQLRAGQPRVRAEHDRARIRPWRPRTGRLQVPDVTARGITGSGWDSPVTVIRWAGLE